jgi:hypothetical protein
VELFSHSGLFEPETMYGMINTLKGRLDMEGEPCKKKRAMIAVLVEQINNIIMHSAEREQGLAKGAVKVGICGRDYYIQTSNAIEQKNAERVKTQIDGMAALNRKEIFKLYKSNLSAAVRNEFNPDSKGAGIGIYEIAWRAQSVILYDLTPREDGLVQFVMTVNITTLEE